MGVKTLEDSFKKTGLTSTTSKRFKDIVKDVMNEKKKEGKGGEEEEEPKEGEDKKPEDGNGGKGEGETKEPPGDGPIIYTPGGTPGGTPSPIKKDYQKPTGPSPDDKDVDPKKLEDLDPNLKDILGEKAYAEFIKKYMELFGQESFARSVLRAGTKELLGKIIAPEIKGGRTSISYKQEARMDVSQSSEWDIDESLAASGGLFPGSHLGRQRKPIIKKQIPRKIFAGHFLLMIDTSGSNTYLGVKYKCANGKMLETQMFCLTIWKEAKRRGDYMSVLMSPLQTYSCKKNKNYTEIEDAIYRIVPDPRAGEDLDGMTQEGAELLLSLPKNTNRPVSILLGDFGDPRLFESGCAGGFQELTKISDLYIIHNIQHSMGESQYRPILDRYKINAQYFAGTDPDEVFPQVGRRLFDMGFIG